MPSRTLVFGDIHGCDAALAIVLDKLNVTADDTVVLLGDVVSRGPATRQCVERLMELRKTCAMVFIRGNHEEMMLDAINRGKLEEVWLKHGGKEALASYGGGYENIPSAHIEFLGSSIGYWESETEIYTHANLEPEVPLEKQTGEWLRWVRFLGIEDPHPSGKRVLCGHTPQPSGMPAVIEGWVCLDTWAYNGGFLSALDVESNVVYQARQSGEYREAPLSKPADPE